jgi:hypothetical protein
MTNMQWGLIDGDAQQVPCQGCGGVWHALFNLNFHGD